MSIEAFAGVDGGATRTRARVVDPEGRLIGEGEAGPGSLTLSPEMAAESCKQALRDALGGQELDLSCCRITFGLAGSRQTAKRLAFEQHFPGFGAIDVISDGYAALLGAHQGSPGAIVITGTGTVGLSLGEDGKIRQVGGYGPIVGDEGGGNWLGRLAVRASLRALDDATAGEGALPPLAASIMDLMGGDHEAMLTWIAKADATRFATLVPIIIDHDAKGDPLARDLLHETARETARLIRLASRKGELNVSMLGGLAQALEPRLPSTIRATLTQPAADPMAGALLRARGLAPPEAYA